MRTQRPAKLPSVNASLIHLLHDVSAHLKGGQVWEALHSPYQVVTRIRHSGSLWEMQVSKFQPWRFWFHRPGVGLGVQVFDNFFQVVWLQPLIGPVFPCTAGSFWTLAGPGNSPPPDGPTPGRAQHSVKAQLTLNTDGWVDGWMDRRIDDG